MVIMFIGIYKLSCKIQVNEKETKKTKYKKEQKHFGPTNWWRRMMKRKTRRRGKLHLNFVFAKK